MDTFKRIQDLGVRIVFDDFGTGYASLSYLKKFPLDGLKIDRSFVRDLLINSDDAAIVGSTVGLSRQLGLSVIAEGIEDRATADFLLRLGCEEGQGYFFGRPMPVADFDARFDPQEKMGREGIHSLGAGRLGRSTTRFWTVYRRRATARPSMNATAKLDNGASRVTMLMIANGLPGRLAYARASTEAIDGRTECASDLSDRPRYLGGCINGALCDPRLIRDLRLKWCLWCVHAHSGASQYGPRFGPPPS